jgi:glycosyltransferase involved in cell wall biosynthesis
MPEQPLPTEAPPVTVVITCYNLGRYLAEAVASVRGQTLAGCELIIVDDGSTDSVTVAELDRLGGAGCRIVRTANQGLPAARNTGIGLARGRYILPLDADDRIAPDFLTRAVAVLDADPAVGIVCGGVELFGAASGPWLQPAASLPGLLFENSVVATSVFRCGDWVAAGGYRRCMVHGWEDWDLWLALVAMGLTVVRLPDTVFYYRIRTASMTCRMTLTQKLHMIMRIAIRHRRLYWRYRWNILERLFHPRRRTIVSPR